MLCYLNAGARLCPHNGGIQAPAWRTAGMITISSRKNL